MAVYDQTRPLDAGRPFAGWFDTITLGVFSAIVAWNDARATRNSLAALTDHELDDIGLVRGDIEGISRRTF